MLPRTHTYTTAFHLRCALLAECARAGSRVCEASRGRYVLLLSPQPSASLAQSIGTRVG